MVRTNVTLRDVHITASALDERKEEVLATGLLSKHACSTNAARVDGAGFTQARRDKELKHHELVECARRLLVVVAI